MTKSINKLGLWVALIAVTCMTFMVTAASAADYKIRPGDTLRVEVLEDETINRDVLVGPDGRISVPLVGTVSVGNSTLGDAGRRLSSALAPNFAKAPNVLVSLRQLKRASGGTVSRKVYVIGEVNKPGYVDVDRNTTLLQALALAGGVTAFAASKRIQLRRITDGGETVYNFNYERVVAGQSDVGTSKVLGGDVLVVPTRRLFE